MTKNRNRRKSRDKSTKQSVGLHKHRDGNLTLNKLLVVLFVLLSLILLLRIFDQSSDALIGAITIVATVISYFYRSHINDFLKGREFGRSVVTFFLMVGLFAVLGQLIVMMLPPPVPITESPASQADLGVVVAQFARTGGTEYEPDIDMLDVLNQVAAQIGGVNVTHYGRTIESDHEALQIAEDLNATMVVYGRVTPGGVTAHYRISPQYKEKVAEVGANVRVARNEVPNFEVFLYNGMDINYILGLLSGQLSYLRGNYTKALDAFSLAENALDLSRVDDLGAQILFTYRGHTLDALGRYEEAITNYDQALTMAKTCLACIQARRAWSHLRLGNFETALAASNASILAGPRHANPLVTRSNVYYERGIERFDQGEYSLALTDFQLAIADLKQALQFPHDTSVTNHNLALAYYYKGLAYTWLNDHKSSIDSLKQSIQINPSFPSSHFTLAEVQYSEKNYTEALYHYQQALKFGIDDPTAPVQHITERINELEAQIGNE